MEGSSQYYTSLIALCACVSKLRSQEARFDEVLKIVEQGMQFDQETRHACRLAFDNAIASSANATTYAESMRSLFGNRPHLLGKCLVCLLQLCAKSQTIPAGLDVLLRDIARAFGFRATVYESLRAHFVHGEVSTKLATSQDSATAASEKRLLMILGCTEGASNIEIRDAYRKLALTHHPDLYESYSLPPATMSEIRTHFSQIQDAYDQLKKIRGIR